MPATPGHMASHTRATTRLLTILAAGIFYPALASLAFAEEPAPLELTVSPAAEPVPALRYHLLPPLEDRVPGNATPIYLRLVYEQGDEWRRLWREEPSRLLEMPFDEMPLDDAARLVEIFDTALEQMSAASRRSECDWQYVVENRDPLMVLLPDAQSMRNNSRLLAVAARYYIRTGNFPAALTTLGDGLALGEHVARAPFLVNQLVGVASDRIMLSEMDHLVELPDAPNLYWALAELPRPLISLRQGLASESQLLVMRFPELGDLSAPLDWSRLATKLRGWASEIARSENDTDALAALAKLQEIPKASLDRAREALPSMTEITPDTIADMGDAEVEVRYTVALHRETSAASRKWFYAPYSASVPDYVERTEALRRDTEERELYPLVSFLTPIRGNLPAAIASLDRLVARQQAIEALRMHAAATGQLPATLDDVKLVPVPLDPATGTPFRYTRDGDAAVLDVTYNFGMNEETLRLPVRIRLREQQ